MPHSSEHHSPSRPLGQEEAQELAETLKALASPSRLRVLVALLGRDELTVEQLSAASDLTQSATSHNLRLLRSIRLVRARRAGRHVFYSLHDHHLPELLTAIRNHHEHLAVPRPQASREPSTATVGTPQS